MRNDPVFKLALERLPGERDLSSQSTVSRWANLPDRRMLLRLKALHDAATSLSPMERIIARVVAGAQCCDTLFIVTNLTRGSGKGLYAKLYCARGQAE